MANLEGVSSFRAVYKSVMMGMHQREKRTMIQGLDDLQFMLRVEHLLPPTVGERVEVHDFWGGEWHAAPSRRSTRRRLNTVLVIRTHLGLPAT